MPTLLQPIVCTILWTFFSCSSFGQDTAKVEKSNKLVGVPVLFYLPETNFGFGGLLNYSFNTGKTDTITNVSSVKFGAAYTLNRQLILHFPFHVFFPENNYLLDGEAGYYIYTYNYYGKGYDIPDYEENYASTFPRIRINFLRKYKEKGKLKSFVGFRYWFETQTLTEYIDTGRFARNEVFGANDNRSSAIGFVHIRDSRKNVLFPSSGVFETLSLQYDHPIWGSKFKFLQLTYDWRKYWSLPWGDIFAANIYSKFTFGDAPFNHLSMVGGTHVLRGYYRGRYRDDHIIALQAAYRKHLFWRLGVEAFAGTGGVFNNDSPEDFLRQKFTLGGGLRLMLDKQQKLNLRLDYGWAPNSSGFYFTLAEAF